MKNNTYQPQHLGGGCGSGSSSSSSTTITTTTTTTSATINHCKYTGCVLNNNNHSGSSCSTSGGILHGNKNQPRTINGQQQQQQQGLRVSRSSTRKKPFHFISNMWKMKKIIKYDDIMFHREMNCRARSEPSVSTYSCTGKGCQRKSSPSFSMLSLSPAKFQKSTDDELEVTRLRLSRNDNPFVQKVLASRDNVTTDVIDDTESDDAILILMSDELNGDAETDPLALPQVHEHMIRSPPPTFWPRAQKTVFNFSGGQEEAPCLQRAAKDAGVAATKQFGGQR
ncbi:uncharacterized protein LOC126572070 [Anopheles aquasalis]|uniref:uncharacterized protein LOC126572070 n=1 Tax=Anopheles aquasalis TaxID=42839 RepID=UPI00215B0C9F|nr:uncharacterized protein LOC126572070 [Anopheles aquasalis]